MDLLALVKIFLFLGCISYMIGILSFIKRHTPKIRIQNHTKKEIKEDGRNETEE